MRRHIFCAPCHILMGLFKKSASKRPTAADCAAVQAFVAEHLAAATGLYTDVDELYRRFIQTTSHVRLPFAGFLAALRTLKPDDVFANGDAYVMTRHSFPLNQRTTLH